MPTVFDADQKSLGEIARETRALADRMMRRARPVEEVVLSALASVDRGQLYALPMADARWMWRLKRAAPGSFRRIVAAGMRALDKKRS